ncbi:hypothetical protein E4O00_03485 [Treponema sp. OMZ 788]|uniref:hypothetical protein n=1 Tax=Treponema sp. OMZ 788 TaxID=2563664 RepID=UPI0020A5B2C6|nr:hypothetical protein [Treponema sp. OMZ 788]UTC65234.1 hypothetical protein E4O00_03485 [Treponema sp. OMZ 788]
MSDEKTVLTEEKKNRSTAKRSSLAAQIFSAGWIAILTICKGFGFVGLDESDIIYSGIAIAGVFSPVYFSIWLDKIKDIKLG